MSPGWVLCHCSRRGAFPSESLGDSFIILQSSVEGWGPLDEEEMNRKEYSWLKTASSLAGLVSFWVPSALGLLMAMGIDTADRTRTDGSRPGLQTT